MVKVTGSFTIQKAAYSLAVVVLKGGKPVSGANVLVVSKAIPTLLKPIPDYAVGKTDAEGKIFFNVPDGIYLVLADDGTDWRAFKDDVAVSAAKPTTVTLSLVEKSEARYFVKLYLTVDAAGWVAPIVSALGTLLDKVVEVADWILKPLGIEIPGSELARHFDIEKVEGKGKEVTIWVKYTGSPLPQAVVIGIIIIAILILLVVVAPIVFKWTFGEAAPVVYSLVWLVPGAVAIAGILGVVAYFKRR